MKLNQKYGHIQIDGMSCVSIWRLHDTTHV